MALQPHWSAEVDRVSAVHRAAVALPDAVAARDVATAERDATYAALNKAEAQLNEVVRMRLESAASWLATMLRDGEPCEVCGSVEHPAPHPRALDAPGEHDERRARTVARRAQRAKEAADERLTVAREQVARLESTSGGMLLADVEADRAAVTSRLTGAREAAVRLTDLDAVLADLDAQLARDRAGLETSARLADVLAERLATLQAQDDDRIAQLVEAVGEGLDIDGHVVRVHRCDEAAQALLAALRDLAAAEAEQENASAAAHRALAAAASRRWHRCGYRSSSRQRSLRCGRPHSRDTTTSDGRRRSSPDPEVALAAQLPAPHLDALEAQQTAARAKAAAAAERSSVLGARLVDVTRWSDEVEASCAAWRPLCERTAVAEAMASLAEGQSADNVLHVSLSAYVLAARLQQVVAAANEHLLPMSSGRYTLEHTMDRSAGDRRGAGGGLGLLVCDQWTGESRDPKTLSGGETFQASLSLALGLSDVVTSEVGGVELRTLFVDEGFGSLDADSLDEVMDVLDGLRAGGRRSAWSPTWTPCASASPARSV
jgi:exonuclease SbcC